MNAFNLMNILRAKDFWVKNNSDTDGGTRKAKMLEIKKKLEEASDDETKEEIIEGYPVTLVMQWLDELPMDILNDKADAQWIVDNFKNRLAETGTINRYEFAVIGQDIGCWTQNNVGGKHLRVLHDARTDKVWIDYLGIHLTGLPKWQVKNILTGVGVMMK